MKILAKFIVCCKRGWIPVVGTLVGVTLIVFIGRGTPPSQPIINRLTTACVPHDGVYDISGGATDSYRVMCNSGHRYAYWVLEWEERHPSK